MSSGHHVNMRWLRGHIYEHWKRRHIVPVCVDGDIAWHEITTQKLKSRFAAIDLVVYSSLTHTNQYAHKHNFWKEHFLISVSWLKRVFSSERLQVKRMWQKDRMLLFWLHSRWLWLPSCHQSLGLTLLELTAFCEMLYSGAYTKELRKAWSNYCPTRAKPCL